MKTRAAKLKSKRASRAGRPRKENVERFPSGKIKPSETEKEVLSVGIEARKRIHGEAFGTKDGLAGYTLGRMFMDGTISKHQLEAGDYYAEIMARYYRTVGIPFPSARAQSIFSIKGHDGEVSEEHANRARRASNRMMEVEGLLLRCEDGPQVKRTVYNLAVMDLENMRLLSEAQLLWLKRGLDALHFDRMLRIEGKSVITEITKSEFVGAA